MSRRVLLVTGSRSEYYIQRGILQAIAKRAELTAELVITGAHLQQVHGETAGEIEREGLAKLIRIPTLSDPEAPGSRARAAGLLTSALAERFSSNPPDAILVPMDREEAIATATAGAYLNIPLFHLGGGDVTGDGVDDSVRQAVSALSHIHLAHTKAAADRLRATGEADWRIHVVGAPGLDRWRESPGVSESALWDKLRWHRDRQPYALLIAHPEFGQAEDNLEATLRALRESGLPVWAGDPNSDPGREGVLARIKDYCRRYPEQFRHYGNLPGPYFQTLLANCSVLVGNSSCGIVESSYLQVPAVDIGPRQRGRLRGENVLSVPAEQIAVLAAIRKAVFDEGFRERVARCESPYGDGYAGERIAKVLAETELDRRLLRKGIS